MPNLSRYPDTPLGRLMAAAGLRWVDVASRAGVAEQSVRDLAAERGVGEGLRLGTLLQDSLTMHHKGRYASFYILPRLLVRQIVWCNQVR